DTLRSMGRADMILSIDAEWGLGMRLEDAPSYPVNGELSTYASEKLMRSYGSRV
ncbi:MAG TPA: glycosyl hydrolase family 3, partial [Porphyromonadaceae bacterium]|nr:glycosyl hydrolase family 3 [Porphyromonadaceae bacterium]